jgi:N-acetylglucosaminyl-diphospho-decaprenol L-rhamnosyltransferase
MILSVVIVSYNVKYFLEQCLSSLKKAVEGSADLCGETEVWVVDNASVDGSPEFLIPLYPDFHFIQNRENTGFAKANNQALPYCSGDFILFLNPDTILAEDSLYAAVSFFRKTPDAGALGVKMVNGTGVFLKESKRGFPDPAASFFKMTGLSRLFPRSKIFASYYQGHLDETKTNAVDILSGAFMMVRKSVLEKTGGFDERFFMYAEDIDLSWRIREAGFQNYYLADTTIIHFKGESTPRDLRYLKLFYSAMILFMKKHFKGPGSSLRLFLLMIAVRVHQISAYFFKPLYNKGTASLSGKKIPLIKGEPADQEKWKRRLAMENGPAMEEKGVNREIIFCEGPRLDWKKIIKEISERPGYSLYWFQGSGTHAAVGSHSSRFRGEVLEL